MLMADSEHPNTRTFTAFEQGGQHIWKYGSQILSNLPVFTTTFNQSLSDGFFHTVIINGDTCTDCMKLCLGDVPRKVAEINTETEEIFVPQGVVPLGDEVGEMPGRETLKAVPNPTNDKWNIIFEASKKSEGIVNIYNVKGECLYSKNIHLEKGTNEFEVDCQTWQAGVYLLKITEDKNETSIRLNKQ